MNPWTALLIGLLLGWLIEYAIDWLFWRRRSTDEKIVADLQEQLRVSEERSAELETQLTEAQTESETWQSRSNELELEVEATATAEKEAYKPEEFKGSLQGKLAALGIGAAAGVALAEGSDSDEEADIDQLEDELLVVGAAEPIDDEETVNIEDPNEEAASEEVVDPSDTDIVGEEVEESVEDEVLVVAELDDEELVEVSANEIGEPLETEAVGNEEAVTIEETGPADQEIEPAEIELDIEDAGDTFASDVPESSIDDDFPAEAADSADEDAFASSEGGQES